MKRTSLVVVNALIAGALVTLFVLLATPVHGHTKEPDRSECGSMFSVLQDGVSQGGEPRIDQAAFNKSCVRNAQERRVWVGGIAAAAVGLGAFAFLYRRSDRSKRSGRTAVVQPFRS